MKKIILILVVAILAGCVKESKRYSHYYSIKNISSKDIILKFYDVNTNQLEYRTEIILKNNEIFDGGGLEFDQPLSLPDDMNYYIHAYRGSDSLVVIYNNEKKSTMSHIDVPPGEIPFSDPIDRNVFRHGNYVNIGGYNFQFTITEEDYNNAADCNGDCD